MANEFQLAWEHAPSPNSPWEHLEILWFRGHEEMSALYRYELVVLAKNPNAEIDLQLLIGSRATLRIRTYSEPNFRLVHGVISEAEDLTLVPEGMVYRVVLSPPFVRADHRQRSRIFLDKTIRRIVDAVITSDPSYVRADGLAADPVDVADPSYSPAKDRYTWRTSDSPRLDAVTARPFCVEYVETDFNFTSRLLEDEGVSYHFEHGDGLCLLVLSDRDAGRTRLSPFKPLGLNLQGRAVQNVKQGARLRATKVRLYEYNWRKPALEMLAQAEQPDPIQEQLFEDFYPGGYVDSPAQGAPLANARMDRLAVEAEYATFVSSCRLLGAGSIFVLEFQPKPKSEGEYLVTKLDVYGEQAGAASVAMTLGLEKELLGKPWEARFECARRGAQKDLAESRFRPLRTAKRPRVQGSQTAFVTAEPQAPNAEINVGGPLGDEIGCVRLRFLWDKEEDRLAKEPSSCWVRVSHFFAGAAQGAVFHPRVGVEVIVEFLEGDPDRPIVTGRVYNGQNRPPVPGKGAATESTMKTFSSPGGGNFNEIYFQDLTGREQIRLEASRNYDIIVDNDRSESVAHDGSSDVGNNRSESTGVNRSTSVGANNMEVVGANESVAVVANQSVSVGLNRTTLVGVNNTMQVGADQAVTVEGSDTFTVAGVQDTTIGAAQTITIGAAQSITIGGAQSTSVGGGQSVSVGGASTTSSAGAMSMAAGGAQSMEAPVQAFTAAGMQSLSSTSTAINAAAMATTVAGAIASVAAPFVSHEAAGVLSLTGPVTIMSGGTITITGGTINVDGSTVNIKGGSVSVDGGGLIDMGAGLIKLN